MIVVIFILTFLIFTRSKRIFKLIFPSRKAQPDAAKGAEPPPRTVPRPGPLRSLRH